MTDSAPQQETTLKTLTNALICASITFATGSALAMDDMKKGDVTSKDTMTMQQCKDLVAMVQKDGMKKDDAMMKKDTMCADMKKKDGMTKSGDSATPPNGIASGAMKR